MAEQRSHRPQPATAANLLAAVHPCPAPPTRNSFAPTVPAWLSWVTRADFSRATGFGPHLSALFGTHARQDTSRLPGPSALRAPQPQAHSPTHAAPYTHDCCRCCHHCHRCHRCCCHIVSAGPRHHVALDGHCATQAPGRRPSAARDARLPPPNAGVPRSLHAAAAARGQGCLADELDRPRVSEHVRLCRHQRPVVL